MVKALTAGQSCRTAAARFGVSVATVVNQTSAKLAAFGVHHAAPVPHFIAISVIIISNRARS